MFLENQHFPFLDVFREGWQDIRDELRALDPSLFIEWPEKQAFDQGWSNLLLFGWTAELDKNTARCPKATAMARQVPRLVSAGFSKMSPKTHIKAHRQIPPLGVLRLHVPLIIPDNCLFRVGDETREWVEGEPFVFDDTTDHEAWNNSDQIRVVFLIDFMCPEHALIKPKKKLLARLFT